MTAESGAGLYIFSAFLLFVSHAVPSAPGVRDRLLAGLGDRAFRVIYSLLSLLVLVFFVWTYRGYDGALWLFEPLQGAAFLAVGLMPIAFFLVLGRLLTPLGDLQRPKAVRGIYALIRFPGSSGLLLWSLLHLGATGDLKRVVFFATMALISLYALLKNNWVLARATTAEARAFRWASSNVPFRAVLRGRVPGHCLVAIWQPLVVGLLGYALVLWLHPLLFGVNPLAWL
jgi:uncharacterized membrane protein|tara:strand:+ start:17792 stop:18478 length:687 start_codon:yes stop_codon:yes gene_type:complete